MIDDIFVFDCVIHLHDMSNENLNPRRDDSTFVRDMQVGMGEMLRPIHGGDLDYATRTSVEDMHRLVFEESPTDMAMAQVVPVFDWYPDFWAPVELQHAMAAAYPDEVLFCGGVDPSYRGLGFALEEIERQRQELGAVSFKFYNAHIEAPWSCDDPDIAYPMYEKCREVGVDVVQFHKGIPFGTDNLEWGRPNDLQAACRDFPDMNFVMHHLAVPYFDETVAIAGRFPNMYLALSANLAFTAIAPRQVQWQMGNLLAKVGVDKLIYGSEAALAGPPAPYLQAFVDLQIPDDLCDGWGFPKLTHEDRRKILGANFARLMNVEIPAR